MASIFNQISTNALKNIAVNLCEAGAGALFDTQSAGLTASWSLPWTRARVCGPARAYLGQRHYWQDRWGRRWRLGPKGGYVSLFGYVFNEGSVK